MMCFGCSEEIEDILYDARIRNRVRHEMTRHAAGDESNYIPIMLNDINADLGYDMAGHVFEVNDQGVLPLMPEGQQQPVQIVPRFVAGMVIGLRAKFGNLPLNEPNRLLIEREYLRVSREGHVRNVDVVLHSQFVYNAYFGESVLDHTASARRRVPKWMRSAFGVDPPTAGYVC